MFLKKIKTYLFFLLIILSDVTLPKSNSIKFNHLTIEHGLSQNQVFFIYQDRKGFLWFCTQDGLNLYDGYEFKIFRHEPGNENSLLDYAVNTIIETDPGIFWIGTREGMSKLNLRSGIFTHYTHNPDSFNSLIDNNIWHINKDSEGKLWITTKNGVSRFDPVNSKFTNYKVEQNSNNTISHNFVFTMVEDKSKNIWLGGRGGLDRYDPDKNKFFNYKLFPDDINNIALNGINSLFIINDTLWIGSYSGLYSTELKNSDNELVKFKKHLSDKSKNISVRSLFAAKDGTIWIGTFRDGLIRYLPAGGNMTEYIKTDEDGSLSENYITSILEDMNGVLWLGTYNSGLNKYNRSSERFKTLSLPKPGGGLHGISSLTEDKNGNLWVGTETGNVIKVINQFSDNPIIHSLNTHERLKNYFNSIEIRTLLQDNIGNIWAGTFGSGIYLINPRTNDIQSIKHSKENDKSLANDFIHSIYQSSDGAVWIGTGAGGLNKFVAKDKSFIHFRHDPNDNTSISSNEVTAVCEDTQGFIWAGTSLGGLNRLDTLNKKFDHFTHDVKDINTISSKRIICLYIDKKSNLWIGTFGGGLNKWLPDQNRFIHYTTKDGLPSNIINSILEDSTGNLWISTDKGISLFNTENKSFKNFDVKDGLQGNEYIHSSGFASKITNHLYFGGTNGLNIFNPGTLYRKGKSSSLAFTNFKIFNKTVTQGSGSALSENIIYADEVKLSHDQNFFTIEFASLDFNNPQKNQYAYMMEGFNTDWISSGNQRFATYTNLDPGEYIFHVKATNSDGIWNDKGISIKVLLLPPWWQTWWAYALYGLFMVSILYSFRQYEMKRVKLRNELRLKDFESKNLQEVDQLKSHFFANISHEFRTPLTLILGLLQKFENKTSDKNDLEDYGVMKRNAIRLLQLINQLLELSKIESGKSKLAASEYDIVKFVKRILVSFASYAEQKNIRLNFNGRNINVNDNECIQLFIDADKMEKIISNLISNAVKYTPEGNEVDVRITAQNNYAEIKVINTGVTISQSNLSHLFDRYYKVHKAESGLFEGTGIGLALVKELIELHKGKISVSSQYDVTEFMIRLPIGKDHLNSDEINNQGETEILIKKYDSAENLIMHEEDAVIAAETTVNNESEIILIVEDHNDLRKYIRETLEDRYQIFEAANGKAGFESALNLIPDLIISDVMMPEMDGYTFSKKVKKNEKTNHIPIILLTAKASTEDRLEGLELGADDYLIKPFNPDELKLRVKNLIKIREQLRQKFTSEMVLKPAEVILPSTQVQFIDKLKSIIEVNMEDEKFGVEKLSEEMGMSRSQLHRKLKAITNQSTTEFIRNFRLHRAAQFILQNSGSMAEIAYKVGFNSQAYFNKSFQDLFGFSPTDYKKNEQK